MATSYGKPPVPTPPVETERAKTLDVRAQKVAFDLAALARFFFGVSGTWRLWLNRRSQRARVTWERMYALLK